MHSLGRMSKGFYCTQAWGLGVSKPDYIAIPIAKVEPHTGLGRTQGSVGCKKTFLLFKSAKSRAKRGTLHSAITVLHFFEEEGKPF